MQHGGLPGCFFQYLFWQPVGYFPGRFLAELFDPLGVLCSVFLGPFGPAVLLPNRVRGAYSLPVSKVNRGKQSYMVVVGKHFTFLLCGGLVGNPHLPAKKYFFTTLPTSTLS